MSSCCPGIVPPYLLEHLTRAGSSEQARPAARALALDVQHREHRVAAELPLAAPRPTTSPPAPHRTVADCHRTTSLPGDVVRREGDPVVGDPAADEAYDGLGATWSLFSEVYGRDSLDGRGLPLGASVHYGDQYDNAFWNGERMVFGDGDAVTFNRFTVAVDVVGHELTHGLTQLTARLVYHDQPGALNESVSDVFGSLVKQRTLGQDAASADWLIGAGLFTAQVHGVALRSMRAPGTAYDDPRLGRDPQPSTMAGYVTTSSDNGGVHVNCGIPNHAFYLAATSIGGRAWEGAGQVWYDVLTGGALAPDVDFAGFAAATVAAAAGRFGSGSSQADAVRGAWDQVGVRAAATVGRAGATGAATSAPGSTSRGPEPSGREVVRVERTGGLAGQRVSREVDVADLEPAQATAWRHLLGSDRLTALAPQPPQPDRYVYRVACAPHAVDVTVGEQQLPGDVLDLLERVLRGG